MSIHRPDLLDDRVVKLIFSETIAPVIFDDGDFTLHYDPPELFKLGDIVISKRNFIQTIELEYMDAMTANEMGKSTWLPRTWMRKLPFHPQYNIKDGGVNNILDARITLFKFLQGINIRCSQHEIPYHWSYLVQISNDYGAFRIMKYRDIMFEKNGCSSHHHYFGDDMERMVSTTNQDYIFGWIETDSFGMYPYSGETL